MDQHKKQRLRDLGYIFARNVFLLTNLIILGVVGALFYFGATEAAFFLGTVLVANMLLGLAQDIRAFLALERLQVLTAPHVRRRTKTGEDETILFTEVLKGDILILRNGDQIPCDGELVISLTLELNEGLITGESRSLPREVGDKVLAGSIITAGSGTMRVTEVYEESRIARMTEGIKSYAVNQSPIQYSVGRVIVISGYVLLLAITCITARGIYLHEAHVLIVKEVGALASTLVPQGLAFAMTLLFAYGAAHLFKRNVLLQEVNATEKLGHIKNLCMDKTGTLTENILLVERMETPEGVSRDDAERASAAYLLGSEDASQTVTAIGAFIKKRYAGSVVEKIPFSSWRSFGAVCVEESGKREIFVAGAPDRFLSLIRDKEKREWLKKLVEQESAEGKRVFSIASESGTQIPKALIQSELTPVAVFIFSVKLRPGINDAIDFFQRRGVRIRIISGDHLETVKAIAARAGVVNSDAAITGEEMATWSDMDFNTETKNYTIFARTLPEQKEKIIEALKLDGFTAMVGDGANDALAIKKADLGIAMWEGAPATREIASVVLMNNSFTALPGGVELADSIIKNAAIFASIFFEFSFASLFLLVVVLVLGEPYPLTPLNITLMNYFTIGIPGILVSYWTIRPASKTVAPTDTNFLAQVLPFTILSAFLQTVAITAVYLLSPPEMKASGSDLYVILTSVFTGFIFFLFTPKVYRGSLHQHEVRSLILVALLEAIFLVGVFQIPLLLRFFEVQGAVPPISALGYPVTIIVVYVVLQYLLARKFWNSQHR